MVNLHRRELFYLAFFPVNLPDDEDDFNFNERFSEAFRFQLTKEGWGILRSQIATLDDDGRGKHRKYLPYVL